MKKIISTVLFSIFTCLLSAQSMQNWNSIEYLLKDTNYRTPIEPEEGFAELKLLATKYSHLNSWNERKKCLLKSLHSALILPDAKKLDIPKAIYTHKHDMTEYTVENVAIEVMSGLWVTGNLYRPLQEKNKKYPFILSAQGHGKEEPGENNSRFSAGSQTMCISLAKMGAIVFNYDMFGIGESGLHMGHEIHRTGLAQCIQTFSTIRLIDYFESLDDIDKQRIGMTGASGGGTQTFLATAVEPRIAVSVPVVQVSCFFPGGCPCESGRPIHTLCNPISNNAEITALAAPRPLLVISDGGDWTRTVDKYEFPFIQRIYEFYDKKDLTSNVHLPDEGHDYGINKRIAMYDFMVEYLGLNSFAIKDPSGNYRESGNTILPWEQLKVFPENHLPEGYISNAQDMCRRYLSLTEN